MNRLSLPVSLLAAATFAAAGAGPYLPSVGPPPLRFVAPPDLTKKIKLLPPIPSSKPPQPASLPAPIAPPKPATNAPIAIKELPPALLPLTNQPPMAPEPPASQPDLLAPQMLLRYFTQGTNKSNAAIFAPVGFTPPPAGSGSSSATYSTSP